MSLPLAFSFSFSCQIRTFLGCHQLVRFKEALRRRDVTGSIPARVFSKQLNKKATGQRHCKSTSEAVNPVAAAVAIAAISAAASARIVWTTLLAFSLTFLSFCCCLRSSSSSSFFSASSFFCFLDFLSGFSSDSSASSLPPFLSFFPLSFLSFFSFFSSSQEHR